jgi:hypothetical protein
LRALCDQLGRAFRKANALGVGLLLAAVLLIVGRYTVANLLRTLGLLVPGDPSSFRRVFSQRRWSRWCLAHLLADGVFCHLVPDGPLVLAADDTVDEHRGKKVYGKSRHVVAVLVRFPFTRRRWAPPLLVAL